MCSNVDDFNNRNLFLTAKVLKQGYRYHKIRKDVASDVGVNFKNVGVFSIERSLFHLFHYTFLQTKHQTKGY